jgi:DNA-binding NarL/FixJ family response regulator
VWTERSEECAAGDALLSRGAWSDARAAFEAVLRHRDNPEALEGLALASWWLDDAEVVFDARERAYRLYTERGDRRSAARVAVWLAWDAWAFRGEHAVSNGWLQRAHSLLTGLPACAEQAWLEVREASLCLMEDGDPDRAHMLATEGIRIARIAHNIDLEMLGVSVQGLALVASGAVAEGMRRLDEVNAAIVAGELKDLVVIGLSCCYLIAACERVRDYDRAVQWCARLKVFCEKWGLRPLFAVCRTQYASICMWRGTWLEAEQELIAAGDELAASRPAMTPDAIVRLAELRRRQGRLTEAASLFDQAGAHGLAFLGRAELAFTRGDMRAAAEHVDRYLRRVPTQNRTDRAAGLELLVRAQASAGDLEAARTALAELAGITAVVGTLPLKAALSLASGWVAMASEDPDTARRHFEDAVDGFVQSNAPYEVARARIDLAHALASQSRTDEAALEARRAIDVLTELKAGLEISRAHLLLESLAEPARVDGAGERGRSDGGLTSRELEVLRLVADGLTNQAIAEKLFVSDHTVHRHLANILNKLSVSSRAAAVAQAARRGLLAE